MKILSSSAAETSKKTKMKTEIGKIVCAMIAPLLSVFQLKSHLVCLYEGTDCFFQFSFLIDLSETIIVERFQSNRRLGD